MIQVTCALIEREGMVLAAQRSGVMRLPWKWEFPGGKLEAGETLEACIVREIREELNLDIRVTGALTPRTHTNKKGMEVCLHPFLCAVEGGEMILREHAQVRWLAPAQFENLDWSEADIPIYREYLTRPGR